MQLALRPYATAGVAVIGAGLIYVTPVAAPNIEQRAVELAAAGDIIDLISPIDGVASTLTGAGGPALAAVTDALMSSGGALSAQVSDALPSAADLELLDPAFWQQFWDALLDPNAGESPVLLLTGALEQLPVIGPLMVGFGVFVVLPVSLLLADAWYQISQFLGIEPYAAAAEGLGTGIQGVSDAALAGAIDPALPAAAVHDLSTALDPGAIAGLGSVFDSAALADIGTLLDTNLITDLGGMLTSLIP